MSTNDVLTLAIAALAVVVPTVAIVVSNNVDRRSARATLTDMTLRKPAHGQDGEASRAASGSLRKNSRRFVRQAEYLMDRLTVRFPRRKALFPESVAATLAWALNQANDFWWADKHWRTATDTADPFLCATAVATGGRRCAAAPTSGRPGS